MNGATANLSNYPQYCRVPRWLSTLHLHSTDPMVLMPMNEVLGNVLLGSLNGTMTGGVSLVPGLVGNALYTSDGTGRVKLGFHRSQCFYNPDSCNQDVTFAVWIKRDGTAQGGYMLNTGASVQHSRGKWPVITMHCSDVIMGAMASQITSLTIVYSTVCWGKDQRKHQSSASLAFVRGIHRRPVNSPHTWPVTRKMFPFDDVIMIMGVPTMVIMLIFFLIETLTLNCKNMFICKMDTYNNIHDTCQCMRCASCPINCSNSYISAVCPQTLTSWMEKYKETELTKNQGWF